MVSDWPNVQRSAAVHGSPTTILPENSEAHFLIRAKRLGGQLQRIVGRDLFIYRIFSYKYWVLYALWFEGLTNAPTQSDTRIYL
jgi:hypothetical protein